MTPEKAAPPHEESAQDGGSGKQAKKAGELRSIEVWARSAPIRLAGYEDDLAEPHILQGID